MLIDIENSINFIPKSVFLGNKIEKMAFQRSTIRSFRSRVIDLIPLNQTTLVELFTERKID
jgi:hypothetical protein